MITEAPVLLNTSLNIRGELIAMTPDDALRCFCESEMDALVIGPYLLIKYENMSRLSILKDLWDYLRIRKKFWLLSIMVLLLLLGHLIIFTEGTALSPFIYMLF